MPHPTLRHRQSSSVWNDLFYIRTAQRVRTPYFELLTGNNGQLFMSVCGTHKITPSCCCAHSTRDLEITQSSTSRTAYLYLQRFQNNISSRYRRFHHRHCLRAQSAADITYSIPRVQRRVQDILALSCHNNRVALLHIVTAYCCVYAY